MSEIVDQVSNPPCQAQHGSDPHDRATAASSYNHHGHLASSLSNKATPGHPIEPSNRRKLIGCEIPITVDDADGNANRDLTGTCEVWRGKLCLGLGATTGGSCHDGGVIVCEACARLSITTRKREER